MLKGHLRNLYARGYVKSVPNSHPSLMGLQEAHTSWQTLSKIIERQAVRSTSNIGVQGILRCDCATKCNTKSCKYKKSERFCNSRCRKGNQKYCNYDH